MGKFLLLGGKFTDPTTGKSYDAGDGIGNRSGQRARARRVTVESDLPLDQMFRNKFENLSGPTAYGPEGEVSESGGDAQTDDPPQQVKQKLERAGEKNRTNYRADRNRKMTTAERAEMMDEEVNDDGSTEESKPAVQKMKAKAEKQASVREKAERGEEEDETETPESADEDEDKEAEDESEDEDEPEKAAAEDDEEDESSDEEEEKPQRAAKPKLRGMKKRRK
jgi:hypothetical protein